MAQARRKQPSKRPLRTARQARSKATVDAIVEAAARILARSGWTGFNTNAVAQQAGVSIGSVYEYFADKQAILDAILDRHLSAGDASVAEAARAILPDSSPGEVAAAVVAGFIRLHRDDPRLHRVLAEVPLSAFQRGRIAALRTNIIGIVANALSGAVDAPELKAMLIVDTADALTHRWVVDKADAPVPAELLASEMRRMLELYVAA